MAPQPRGVCECLECAAFSVLEPMKSSTPRPTFRKVLNASSEKGRLSQRAILAQDRSGPLPPSLTHVPYHESEQVEGFAFEYFWVFIPFEDAQAALVLQDLERAPEEGHGLRCKMQGIRFGPIGFRRYSRLFMCASSPILFNMVLFKNQQFAWVSGKKPSWKEWGKLPQRVHCSPGLATIATYNAYSQGFISRATHFA